MADQQKYTNKLSESRILVIGGSSGIGYGVAEASVEHGASVIISSSSEKRVNEAVEKIQKLYPSKKDNVVGYTCDLSSDSLEENIVELFDKVGKLDHVVFTAGDKLAMMPLQSVTLEKVQKAGMVRFFAPLLVAKHAATHLNPGPASSITLTTGGVSQKPIPNWSAIAGYAGALHSLMRNLALDLKPIRVNLISPGAVDTELWSAFSEEQKKAYFAGLAKSTTTGVVGKVEDVAESYLYVMRDHNVTGSVISTNGGHLLV